MIFLNVSITAYPNNYSTEYIVIFIFLSKIRIESPVITILVKVFHRCFSQELLFIILILF